MLKSILYNIICAGIALVVMAVLNLLIWGEHLREYGVAWFVFFYLIFQIGDIFAWAYNKFHEFHGSK